LRDKILEVGEVISAQKKNLVGTTGDEMLISFFSQGENCSFFLCFLNFYSASLHLLFHSLLSLSRLLLLLLTWQLPSPPASFIAGLLGLFPSSTAFHLV